MQLKIKNIKEEITMSSFKAYKREIRQAAIDLHYHIFDPAVLEKIDLAKDERELSDIMMNTRYAMMKEGR